MVNKATFLLMGSFLVCGGVLPAGPVQGRIGSVRTRPGNAEGTDLPGTASSSRQETSSSYALSPYLIMQPPAARRGEKLRPYSEFEYSRMMMAMMSVGNVPPAISRNAGETVLPKRFDQPTTAAYPSTRVAIIDVLDRGVLLASSRETIRLRGLRIPSETSRNDGVKVAIKEVTARLRELMAQGPLEVQFDRPERDSSGNLLAIVPLPDGSTLNELLLNDGLAMFEPTDFLPDQNVSFFQEANDAARMAHRGLWNQ